MLRGLFALLLLCAWSTSWASWAQLPNGAPYTFADSGAFLQCFGPNPSSTSCMIGSASSAQPAYVCGDMSEEGGGEHSCWYWNEVQHGTWDTVNGPYPTPPPLNACDPEFEFCASDAESLGWSVVGVWMIAFCARVLMWAFRPSTT